jgi:hypothetical protein
VLALRAPPLPQLLADKFGLGGSQPKTGEQLAGGVVTHQAIYLRVQGAIAELRCLLAGKWCVS